MLNIDPVPSRWTKPARKTYNRAMLLLLRESPLSNGKPDRLTFVSCRPEYSIVMKKRVEMKFLTSEVCVDWTGINVGVEQSSVAPSSSTNLPGREMCDRGDVRESPPSNETSPLPGGREAAGSSVVQEKSERVEFLVPEASVEQNAICSTPVRMGLRAGVIGSVLEKQVWPTNSKTAVRDMPPSVGVSVRNNRFVRGLRLIYSYQSKSKRGDFSALVPLSTIQSTSAAAVEPEPRLASVLQPNVPVPQAYVPVPQAYVPVPQAYVPVPQAYVTVPRVNAQQNALLNALLSPRKVDKSVGRGDDRDRSASAINEKHQLFSNLRPKVDERGESKDCTVPNMIVNHRDEVDNYTKHDNMIRETNEKRKLSARETLISALKPSVSMDDGQQEGDFNLNRVKSNQ